MTAAEFLKAGVVRSNMQQYRDKEDMAVKLCAEQLAVHKAPYLAISGGKDSVAAAYILDRAARITGKDFRLWLHLSDASFPGTRETCERVAGALGRGLDVSESTRSAFAILRETDQKRAFGKTGVFFDAVRRYAADKDLVFTGVRARESKRRMTAAKAKGSVFYSVSMGDVTVCEPLLWYDVFDVAATLTRYDAPLHPIYTKAPIEAPRNGQLEPSFIRLGYVTSRDLLNKGTAVFLKCNYPDLFNRAAAVFPEIKSFV